ncbi:hypothetical protein N599_23615 [Saccharopolyspora erythraea D]|nr:hypothetical protein N599_23615 [Saccharopolyspora erythraea D]
MAGPSSRQSGACNEQCDIAEVVMADSERGERPDRAPEQAEAEQPRSDVPEDTGYDEAAGDRITPDRESPPDEEPEPPKQSHPRHLPADIPPDGGQGA